MVNMNGQNAISVLTEDEHKQADLPTTITLNWHRLNGSQSKSVNTRVLSAKPQSPLGKWRMRATPVSSSEPKGTFLGVFIWTFEGPQDSENRTHLGEFEVFIDATFEGL